MNLNATAEELFAKVKTLLSTPDIDGATRNRMMHEVLVLCCHEGVKDIRQAFGNLFSQVDFLCKRHRIKVADKVAIQEARRHSNSVKPLSEEDLRYDARALCLFISAVFNVDIPHDLVIRIPTENRPYERKAAINFRQVRCIVTNIANEHLVVEPDEGGTAFAITLRDERQGIDNAYITTLVKEGTQLNLLDCQTTERPLIIDGIHYEREITPRLIVVEPDFLVDISSIAACFTEIGHHPLRYLLDEMKPRANTQAILLGNFAGAALDDIISTREYQVNETIKGNFKEKALEFCTCTEFDPARFYADAKKQAAHLQEVVDILFETYQRDHAILEPSFICEALGIQGRVDLMTTDYQLLVEQKSGRNINIERRLPDSTYHSYQLQPHFVQLLLYYGVLRHNFHLGTNTVDIRLLYSKYPPKEGLMVVAYYQRLFHEAISYRNEVVAELLAIMREGFGCRLDAFTPDTLNIAKASGFFYQKYLQPELDKLTAPLHALSSLEKTYYCRMMTFVLREQAVAKMGTQEGTTNSCADLWTMPLAGKRDAGIIYTGLRLVEKTRSDAYNGYDTLTLSVPEQGEDFLPNFRTGDMAWLYAYEEEKGPDVRHALLYKGILQEIEGDRLVVHLANGQQNPDIFGEGPFALEHAFSDTSTTSQIQSLHQFITAEKPRRDILLGQRTPRKDTTRELSRHYDERLDGLLTRAKQAEDYFLLVGPPGTGKTSRALRFLVEEALKDGNTLLLMSYTNRAVDEICAMLVDAGFRFIRIGSKFSCEKRFRPYLFEQLTDQHPKLADIRQVVADTPIVVSTISGICAKPYILKLKQFQLAIIDEASQILEPYLMGILTTVKKFILIGDHKQLPAVVQQNEQDTLVGESAEEASLHAICLDDCRSSLFERLLRWERHCGREDFIGILRWQGRMHPDIAEFPNKMFYKHERLEPVPCQHQLETTLHYTLSARDSLDRLLQGHRMLFIASHDCKNPQLSDKVNTHEASIVADVLSRIYRFLGHEFDPQTTVGVIVPYRNQIAMIRRCLEQTGIPELLQVSIDTVERYQGSQRDIIIYSFTIQNQWQLEFLTANCFEEDGMVIDRKLNVAITRARKQMIMTGNPRVLRHNVIFSQLMDFCKEKGGYV